MRLSLSLLLLVVLAAPGDLLAYTPDPISATDYVRGVKLAFDPSEESLLAVITAENPPAFWNYRHEYRFSSDFGETWTEVTPTPSSESSQYADAAVVASGGFFYTAILDADEATHESRLLWRRFDVATGALQSTSVVDLAIPQAPPGIEALEFELVATTSGFFQALVGYSDGTLGYYTGSWPTLSRAEVDGLNAGMPLFESGLAFTDDQGGILNRGHYAFNTRDDELFLGRIWFNLLAGSLIVSDSTPSPAPAVFEGVDQVAIVAANSRVLQVDDTFAFIGTWIRARYRDFFGANVWMAPGGSSPFRLTSRNPAVTLVEHGFRILHTEVHPDEPGQLQFVLTTLGLDGEVQAQSRHLPEAWVASETRLSLVSMGGETFGVTSVRGELGAEGSVAHFERIEGDALLIDGFESGGVSAWSASTGVGP